MTAPPDFRERIAGGLAGLLIGDALGVPYEFHPPDDIPPLEAIEFAPPPGFPCAHPVPPGTWSDDGAQALCLLASLLQQGRFDAADFGVRLVNWYDYGYLAVDGIVFDIGITTGIAVRAIRGGADPASAGPADVESNGNGALMRSLPLALWHRGDDAELVADAHAQSKVTHGHLRSQVCCALYCLWARRLLQEVPEPWADAVRTLRSLYGPVAPATVELDKWIRPDAAPGGHGSGYVVDSLHSVRLACEQPSYEAVVRAAIALGNDTDTTACIAGGIAGIRDGLAAIPERWRSRLRGGELLAPLLAGLLEVGPLAARGEG